MSILEQLIQELKGTQDAGIGLRHVIGDPTTSPDPAYLFAPHGEDSVRVYWNEGTHPLANWLPLEPNDAVEDTVEFLSYLVPGVTMDEPGVQDGNEGCANCGQPNCSSHGSACDSFGKTADLGPVYRWNAHMGEILTSSVTYNWTKVNARQNRGYPKSIRVNSHIDGREIVLTSQKQIWSYLAHYQWVKEVGWSLWGGHGYNGSFPGVLEVVRPGWAHENEYRIDGKGIPDNVYMDPKVIDLGSVAYYEQPWLFAERVSQVVHELEMAGRPPRRATVGGVNNVLVDFALVAAQEWLTFFAKIAARVGMINEFGTMPNGFSFSVTTSESDKRFMDLTAGALGYGYLPTPYGNVPFLPETYCDPAKIPSIGCQRSADECDLSDTYSTTMRLLVRRVGSDNALALQYLDYRKTASMPVNDGDVMMGDAGRWITTYPKSVTGLCERAVQIGTLGMINRAPTIQTIFTNASYRAYLEPERYWAGSNWFKGGPPATIKTVNTATRDLTLTDPVFVSGMITTISGAGGVWYIVSAALNGLDVVPVGTLVTSGNYVGHVAAYDDATNSITVLGDLSGVTNGSAFTLGVDESCDDCPSTESLVVLKEDECDPVRATYTGVIDSSTGGYIIAINDDVIEAMADQDLLGGQVYVAGAFVGFIVQHDNPTAPGNPATIYLNEATNVAMPAGALITIYLDSGCESDDEDVEQIMAYVLVPENIPLTDDDTFLIGFVSKTGATTSVSQRSGSPVPTGYVAEDTGNSTDMLIAFEGQSEDTGGATVWVDLLFESDQVTGVYAKVRIPYSYDAP